MIHNWAGSHTFAASTLHRPESVAQAQEIIAKAHKIRAVGSTHSFNDIADSPGELISMAGIEPEVSIDEAASAVTVSAAITYGDLALALERRGYALHAMASLPHISVAGAIATGTHGSGDRAQSLAAGICAIEFIAADGSLHTMSDGDPDFAGAVVSLGALGVATRVTMRIEPTYQVRQFVFNDVPLRSVLEDFDAITASADSISLFTTWNPEFIESMWIKRRTDTPDGGASPQQFASYRAATQQHPVRGADASVCTPQLGEAGPWHERLPHFRSGFTPSSGREIQVEYVVDRSFIAPVMHEVAALRDRLGPVLQVSEVRTIAADELWLSPAYGRDSISLHFTFHLEPEQVTPLLGVIDETMAAFNGRPHWGKWFHTAPERIAGLYPQMAAFKELAARWDPDGCFRNEFLDTWVPRG